MNSLLDPTIAVQPDPISVPVGLIQLFPARFAATSGCYAEGGGVGLLVRCTGPAQTGQLDLEGRLLPLRLEGSLGVPEDPPDEAILAYLQQELASREARLRAAACQALGQLGAPAAMPTLLQVASEDSDPYVQQAAQAAVVDLEMPVVTREALAGVSLLLECTRPAGERITVGPIETDAHGSVVFRGVPADATCRLRLAVAPVPPDSVVPNLARLLSKLRFHDSKGDLHSERGCTVAVQPLEIGDPLRFGALLRFTPPLDVTRGERLPSLAVCHGAEFWSPAFVQPAIGMAWFSRLPRGEFVARASCDSQSPAPGPSRALLAMHAELRAFTALPPADAGPQLLHPADPRLVAIIERGRREEVVLTVQTRAPELQEARVCFELGSERGELAFTGRHDKPLWRACERLQQRYRGDEAVRLTVRVAPGFA
jgi:hypothetical protein